MSVIEKEVREGRLDVPCWTEMTDGMGKFESNNSVFIGEVNILWNMFKNRGFDVSNCGQSMVEHRK